MEGNSAVCYTQRFRQRPAAKRLPVDVYIGSTWCAQHPCQWSLSLLWLFIAVKSIINNISWKEYTPRGARSLISESVMSLCFVCCC